MPPRKRARVSRATSPEHASQAKSPTPAGASDTSPSKDIQLLSDPWTDEEEIALFKGLMRWKPTGIHKHFHLMNLYSWLLDAGHIQHRTLHTRPAGIWAKLSTLYDLSALDAREDARQLPPLYSNPSIFSSAVGGARGGNTEGEEDVDEDADAYSEAANRIEAVDFELSRGGQGFDEMMWSRRFERTGGDKEKSGDEDDGSTRSESPALLPEINLDEFPPLANFTPTIAVDENPDSSLPEPDDDAAEPAPKEVKKRGRKKGSTMTAAEKEERKRAREKAPSRRSARRAEKEEEAEAEAEAEAKAKAKAEAEEAAEAEESESEDGEDDDDDEEDDDEEEEEEEDDEEEGDDSEDDDDDDDNDEEDEASTKGTPKPRSTRSRNPPGPARRRGKAAAAAAAPTSTRGRRRRRGG